MLCGQQNEVRLWSRNADVSSAINRDRHNPQYLTDVEIPPGVTATSDLGEALEDREVVICAVPSHGVREVMSQANRVLPDDAILVSTVKGIEVETGMRMDQVLQEVLDPVHHPRFVFLSGPSFAREIADHKPTVVTVASLEESFAIAVQTTLSCPWFRCYSATDVVGVEVGGALKNVVAIAVGFCDGMGLGQNARAATMTRGLAEITRLGVKLGANPITFLGLSGIGDLLLTCTGDLSRNRQVGLELGKGRKLDDILSEMKQVAEGVRTTEAACRLAEREGVEMPIVQMVRAVLQGSVPNDRVVELMMTRQLGSENPI